MMQHEIQDRRRRRLLKLIGIGGAGLALAGHGLWSGRASAAEGPAISARDIRRRTIPVSGEQIPAIGLGTARTMDAGAVPRLAPEKLAVLTDVIRLFHAHGARLIDTSPMYGSAEEVVGHIVDKLRLTGDVFMATKVWTRGRDSGIAQMQRSMELLHSDPVDLMQIHNLVDWRTHYRTLRQWKEEGRVRYIGVTHYRSDVHDELEGVLKAEPFDFVQFNYSVLDRNAEQRLLPFCREQGIATLINEPFQTGDLFRRTKGRQLPEWARDFADSWAQVFLKFILAHPAVTCAIPATGNPKHVVDNVMAAYGPLPDASQRRRIVGFMESL